MWGLILYIKCDIFCFNSRHSCRFFASLGKLELPYGNVMYFVKINVHFLFIFNICILYLRSPFFVSYDHRFLVLSLQNLEKYQKSTIKHFSYIFNKNTFEFVHYFVYF